MFVRVKRSGPHEYLQIVQNRREGKKVRQTVVATLGRRDRLAATGAVDQLLRSGARFAERLMVLAEGAGAEPDARVASIGPALVFERLWRETGCRDTIRSLLAGRRHRFDVERAVFMTVLHRLTVSGSDRSAMRWRRDQDIEGVDGLDLHHMYRAMGWLGEPLDASEPCGPAPRRTKDLVEEALFARRRDLFTNLDLVFFDTTSLHFTGLGGETLGRFGKSKDGRGDCRQMVLGMVIDGDGVPVASHMWPGSTADVTTLDLVAERLQARFGVRRVCLVADAGMISKKQVAAVEARGWQYILGARLRGTKEVRETVLGDSGPFVTVEAERQRPEPMELRVKEVRVGGHGKASRRYVVCHNPEQAAKDAATRAELLASLEEKLRSGAKNLIANKGYRRYLKAGKGALSVDREKALEEERFDGMWVLRTNTALPAVEVALKCKQLWMVEQIFRTAKSLLDTRPVFHKTDATICGHVFCSFLALVLRDALFRRMERAGVTAEWADILRDLNALTETVIAHDGKRFAVRSAAVGVAGRIARCVGVRLPKAVRRIEEENAGTSA